MRPKRYNSEIIREPVNFDSQYFTEIRGKHPPKSSS